LQAAIPSSLTSRIGYLARSFRRRLVLALGCVFVLLLLGSSLWQAMASLGALEELRLRADRVERLDNLLIQLMDAENAVRGYLLSGNRAHLEPYEKSQVMANLTLEDIHLDLGQNSGNDAALADLSGLVAIKLRSLDQAVERGIAGEETRIQGKRYTDRIRDSILGLKARLAAEAEASFDRSTRHVERTRWVVATLAACALVLIAILFLVLERQIQLREQLASLLQSENQHLDALVQERTAELNDLASYLTNVREVEKAHLARELHDELGAILTAAKMESGWVVRNLGGAMLAPCLERLTHLEQLLESGITLKRRIIDDLRPPLLEMLGLVSALRGLGDDFVRNARETLTMELPEADIELAPEPALAIFRIAQEALTNISKHADAMQVKLALRIQPIALELEVADDGRGFKTGSARWKHHGLAGMKHRVLMCSGDFSVTSQPGSGTRIMARIPMPPPPVPGIVAQEVSVCRT
jgi:signal transduction histidine kinase